MDNKIKSLMGLLDGGKRVYQQKDGEVDADQFEYCQVLNQILFGPKGLVDTLGPTWEMVHDPRFEKIENLFVITKKSMFGGDAREGVQTQTADGTFTGSFAGLQQYAEMLGEGRYLLGVIKAFSIIEALDELFPDRKLRISGKDSLGALKLLENYPEDVHNGLKKAAARAVRELPIDTITEALGWGSSATISIAGPEDTPENFIDSLSCTQQWIVAELVEPKYFYKAGYLSPTEEDAVREKMLTYGQYKPHAVENWSEDRIWGLIRLEYANYFNRKGVPNQDAKTLFAILKGGLLGLVTDFAEVANVQETVLLDDPNTLYDPTVHGEDASRVSMEVDLLERALTYRAELRVTAAKIISSLGIGEKVLDLTDFERDQLLKIVYESKWPIEKTEMIMKVLGYMNQIRFSGLSLEERRFKQLTDASISAQKYVANLRSGEILPINRETDGVAETSVDASEKIMEKILGNPLFAHLYMRYANLEERLTRLKARLLAPYSPLDEPKLVQLLTSPSSLLDEIIAEHQDFAKHWRMIEDWIYHSTGGRVGITIRPGTHESVIELLKAIEPLAQAIEILAPAFTELDFELTEESCLELFAKVEEIDPTPKPKTAQFEGTLDPENRIEETVQ
jgi:hypothetical protein